MIAGSLLGAVTPGNVLDCWPVFDRLLAEDEKMLRREGFLRVKEAAELLGVSPNTVRAWGGEGKIPEYRHPVNRYRLYKRAELERILKKLERSVSTATKGARKRRAK